MVYTSYLGQFSAIEGFDLNFSHIFPLENANLLDVGFGSRTSFSEGSWFLRAVMDLLEGKVGSEGTCLGIRGADRLTCLCWTGTSRDLTAFLQEIWEMSSQLMQLLQTDS